MLHVRCLCPPHSLDVPFVRNIHGFEQALQEAISSFKSTPVVWNEVWSVPVNTEPNGALPGESPSVV